MTKLNEKATKSWVLALASIASCMVALDAMVVTTALSAIQGLGRHLGENRYAARGRCAAA